MQRFWHIPVYPRPRRVTATSLPVWDEKDPTPATAIREETFFDTIPAWGFLALSLAVFLAIIALFGYVITG